MSNNENYSEENKKENLPKIEDSNIPEDIKNIMKNIPVEDRERVIREFSFISTGMKRNVPFEDIMTPEHLTAIISNSDKDSQRFFEDAKLNKIYLFLIYIVSLIFFLVLVNSLIDKNPDILIKIISHSVAVILGIAGGYSLGYNKCKSEK